MFGDHSFLKKFAIKMNESFKMSFINLTFIDSFELKFLLKI